MVKTMVCSSLWSAFCTDCSSHKNFWIKFWPTLIMIIPSSLSRTMWKHSLLLFLPDRYFIESALRCPHFNYNMLPFFRPKGVADETLGKVKQGRLNALWFNLSSVPVVSGRLSLPLRTHDQFQHWRTPTNSAVWPVPYACAQPHHPGSGSPYWA